MEPARSAPATRAKTEKKKVGGKGGAATTAAEAPKTYVPPPPPDGAKIPPPAGVPAVKTFPISSGPPPKGMSFPGVAEAAPKADGGGDAPAADEEGQDAAPGEEEEEIDDGFTPEQRRKNQLETDPNFKKYLMMYRMKIGVANIRNKIEGDKLGFNRNDIDVSDILYSSD